MGAQGVSGLDFESDEWVRGSWRTRRLGPDGSKSSYSTGTLILTNQRLLFSDDDPVTGLLGLSFDDLAQVHCKRSALTLHTLVVETSAGRLFAFKTKKFACRQIAARAQMRRVA